MRQVKPREGRGLPKTHSRARLSAQVTPGLAGVGGGCPRADQSTPLLSNKRVAECLPQLSAHLGSGSRKSRPQRKEGHVVLLPPRDGTVLWGSGVCCVYLQPKRRDRRDLLMGPREVCRLGAEGRRCPPVRSAPCECAGVCVPARVGLCVMAYALGCLCVSARCVWTRESVQTRVCVVQPAPVCVCTLACLV